MEWINGIALFLASTAIGYVGFILLLKLLPSKLSQTHRSQRDEVLQEARKQAIAIKTEAVARELEKRQLHQEELEEHIKERLADLTMEEEELKHREQSAESAESRIERLAKDASEFNGRVQSLKDLHQNHEVELQKVRQEYQQELGKIAKEDIDVVLGGLREQLVESRRHESQKVIKFLQEELQSSQRRLANRSISRAMARYAPQFAWPKMVNHVEIADAKKMEQLATTEAPHALLVSLKEKAGIEIEVSAAHPNSELAGIAKLSGGLGIAREAARLALAETLGLDPSQWGKALTIYDKFRGQLEHQAVILGAQAVKELQLEGIHPEVQKLVGYLNWRTSYRQNQYLHSFEVARLAGIVASELGVDPSEAKRCGLLHDIGKAIDYRIEGSHAVISGDYADRFGEKRFICDTLMSHHNDLIIDTPLAYVLKTADTLSGARPGARVNLEEGYQVRLSAIDDVIRGFPGVTKSAIMNGGREIHIEVNHKRIKEDELQSLTTAIAKKIEANVAFPGQIKVLVSRRFEASSVA